MVQFFVVVIRLEPILYGPMTLHFVDFISLCIDLSVHIFYIFRSFLYRTCLASLNVAIISYRCLLTIKAISSKLPKISTCGIQKQNWTEKNKDRESKKNCGQLVFGRQLYELDAIKSYRQCLHCFMSHTKATVSNRIRKTNLTLLIFIIYILQDAHMNTIDA